MIIEEGCKQLDYEGEVAVVIGRTCRKVSVADAMQYVYGFTCANDVTARDIQRKDGQWTRGKGYDTFCPLGPWIETELHWQDTAIETRLNGEVRQSSSTGHMITPIDAIVSYVSSVMTLNPGDVIITGTPEGVGPMREGDCVEVTVQGIGTLRNVVAEV